MSATRTGAASTGPGGAFCGAYKLLQASLGALLHLATKVTAAAWGKMRAKAL